MDHWQQVVDGLALMRAFFKIADAEDRRKVIALAAAPARSTSPPPGNVWQLFQDSKNQENRAKAHNENGDKEPNLITAEQARMVGGPLCGIIKRWRNDLRTCRWYYEGHGLISSARERGQNY